MILRVRRPRRIILPQNLIGSRSNRAEQLREVDHVALPRAEDEEHEEDEEVTLNTFPYKKQRRRADHVALPGAEDEEDEQDEEAMLNTVLYKTQR